MPGIRRIHHPIPFAFSSPPQRSSNSNQHLSLEHRPNHTVIDGPFPHTHELVAGFWLWEVRDKEEALAGVKRCPNPMPQPSEIEIRPIYAMDDLL